MFWRKFVFVALIFLTVSPIGSPPIALAIGLLLALTVGNPYPNVVGTPTRILLQASVVLLGFGMDIKTVYRAGSDGILFAIATIFGTLGLGFLLGRLLKVDDKTSSLISSGTAICGGSAIAAVAPAIDADSDQVSVSLGTIFVLNSIALFLFPLIGHAIGLSPNQFGIWAAIAIHDTSSVVGASAAYGATALAVATTVKLTRALWIAPIALMFAMLFRKAEGDRKIITAIPWFIFLFLIATLIRTYAPSFLLPSFFDSLVNLAKAGLTVTLFFIGASLSIKTLRLVGFRPLLQGVVLWLAISIVGLIAVMRLV
ncbi:MAG: putative sulfate exporter family transporter [Acidobacteria bacterium]|nr:putative sulfate exporter family transporter [Acidobacteriota bacterium]MCA1607943.1 putative sulfate exporter family transporter [Acidobacteriota bacterium]